MPTPEITEHPPPTDATVKELYAHAFSCARPGCGQWLYKQAEGSGESILNSRVAHIHARRRNGPRWLDGMSSEDNRSAPNLLLLCIPDSYEVDGDEDQFPPETLHAWRAAQREEHANLRQAWTITDAQAREVAQLSFDSPAIAAPIITSVVRAAERLAMRALSTRPAVAIEAAAWRSTWDQARAPLLWDSTTGERIYAKPSRADTQRHQAALQNALKAAQEELRPLVEDVVAEVATARHTTPRQAAWCDRLTRAVEDLVDAVGTWPGPPPVQDDDRLDKTSSEVRKAAAALASALRGEDPEPPPAAPTDDDNDPGPTDTGPGVEGEDLLARHADLLDQARPWLRVPHRPYDADLRNEMVAAAVDASTIPPVPSALPIGLWTTAGLAAGIARNATEPELAALIASDRSQRPLVVAVALLLDLWRVLDEKGLSMLADQARAALLEELDSQDWSDGAAWIGNDVCGARMFNTWRHLDSADAPRLALSAALRTAPDRLDDVVLSCADWVERVNTNGGENRFARSYRELPDWFPTEAVLEAAEALYPQVVPATDDFDGGPAAGVTEVEHLLGRVLRLAAA